MPQVQQPTPQQAAQQLQAANLQARMLVVQNAYPMLQQIFSQTISPETQQQVNIPPQNVGLIKGFIVKLQATINNPNAGSSALALTPWGPANLLQNILFTDLQ